MSKRTAAMAGVQTRSQTKTKKAKSDTDSGTVSTTYHKNAQGQLIKQVTSVVTTDITPGHNCAEGTAIRELDYKNNPHGWTQVYNKHGYPLIHKQYSHGKAHGYTIHYEELPSGKTYVQQYGFWLNGLREGEHITFWPNGLTKMRQTFHKNLKHGPKTIYDSVRGHCMNTSMYWKGGKVSNQDQEWYSALMSRLVVLPVSDISFPTGCKPTTDRPMPKTPWDKHHVVWLGQKLNTDQD